MRIAIHPTQWLVEKVLRPGRTERLQVWDGVAADGTPCRLFVYTLQCTDALWDPRARVQKLLNQTTVSWQAAIERPAPRDPTGPEIVIEPLPNLLTLCGVDVRQWRGRTKDGIECQVYVHLVATREDHGETIGMISSDPSCLRLVIRDHRGEWPEGPQCETTIAPDETSYVVKVANAFPPGGAP